MNIFACLQSAESKVQKALAAEWAAIPSDSKSELLVILQATNIIKAAPVGISGDDLLAQIAAATGQPFVDSFLTIVDKVAASIGITIPPGTDAVTTLELIAANLAPRTGDNWGDTVLRIGAYALTNLVPAGNIVRTVAIPLVQWVYDNVFKPAVSTVTVPAIVAEAATILANLPAASAPTAAAADTSQASSNAPSVVIGGQ